MASKSGNHTCILHSKTVATDSNDHLTSPQSYESWLTLFEAAKIRKFTSVLDVAQNLEEHEDPSIFYHRKCRSIFTMKRDLETKRKNQNPHDEEDEDFKPTAKKRNVTTPTRVYSKDCIFCEKVKYIPCKTGTGIPPRIPSLSGSHQGKNSPPGSLARILTGSKILVVFPARTKFSLRKKSCIEIPVER